MTNLIRYDIPESGIELHINQDTGEVFASIRGIARMIDKPESTIRTYVKRTFEGAQFSDQKMAEILTPGGTQGAKLLDENQILEIITKYKPALLKEFGRLGLRMYLHVIAGYEVKSSAIVEDTKPGNALPKRDVVEYFEVIKGLPSIEDLNLRQLLRALAEDELTMLTQKQLPSTQPMKQYTIAKVRATELGYSVKEIGNGSALGKFLANNVPVAYEQRVGKYNVKHYEVNDTLDTAIKTYFGMKRMLA
ncbi:MAG: hypothetical protein ACRDBG_17110 [Waterburya sp.]